MGDVQIIQWIDSHGIFLLFVGIISNTLVGYLPSPTKDSKASYVYLFKVSNSLVFQFARAFKSKIENSPNWEDAIQKHLENSDNPNLKNPLFLGKD